MLIVTMRTISTSMIFYGMERSRMFIHISINR
jgi:hypothetical protein